MRSQSGSENHRGIANREDASLRDLSNFVPEGLNDRSQAIYCLEPVQNRSRPVGCGVIRSRTSWRAVAGET